MRATRERTHRIRRTYLARVFALCCVAVSSGCAGEDRLPWSSEPLERRVLTASWDTLWVFRSGVNDTILSFPRALVGTNDGSVYVSDMGMRVIALDSTGSVRWIHGRKGAGPGEYRNINDIRLVRDQLYLYDQLNSRISVLDQRGGPVRMISTQGLPTLQAIVPLHDGRIAALAGMVGPDAGNRGVVVFDTTGKELQRVGIPLDDFPLLSGLARQGVLASDGDQWAFAYHLANGWTTFSSTHARGVGGRYVEDVRPPQVREERTPQGVRMRIEGRPVCSACTVSLSDSLLFVHFGGHSAREHGVLDVYDWTDGRYLASIDLPSKASHVAVHGRRVYLLKVSPVPHVVALSLVSPDLLSLRRSQ